MGLLARLRGPEGSTKRGERPLLVLLILLLASFVAALLIEVIAGPAWASPNASSPKPTGPPHSPAATASATPTTATFQTVGTNVNIRAGASTDTAVVTTVRAKASTLRLACYETGQSINGDSSWYRATYGQYRGYIAGYWVDTGPDPAARLLPHC